VVDVDLLIIPEQCDSEDRVFLSGDRQCYVDTVESLARCLK
jgi:hypothetical protein